MSSEIQEENISSEVECEFEISQFEAFNVVSDYIQSPEVLAGISIGNLLEATRDQIKNASRVEEPPFISGIYGTIRKEAYAKFSKIIEHYSGTKRRQYKKMFYQDFDVNNEQLFNNSMPVTEYYQDEIEKQRNKNSSKKSRREYDLSDAGKEADVFKIIIPIDLTSQFLSAEVDKLILKWHILVDQTLNELIRCELYELKDEVGFRALFENSSAQLKKKQGSSWTDWLSDGFNFLKNMFGSNSQKSIEKEGTGIDLKEFYELTMTMCCEDIVSGYCNNFDHHYNEKVLIKMKGFMILLTENIAAYHQNLSRSVDKLLIDDDNQEKAKKSLDDIFEQLKTMEKNMTEFDQGFLKDYFKEEIKEASTGATHPSDENSQVAADFLKQ